MDWIDTPDSSNIARFGYDEDSTILFIEFKSGGTYQYFDVPVRVFDGMKSADSKGQYFAQYVKGEYRFARI